jgi:hypothetical protein
VDSTVSRYLVAQAVAIGAYVFVPIGGWTHYLWQVAVGWASALAAGLGARRTAPTGALVWYLFAAGLFLNASGLVVNAVTEQIFHQYDGPGLADIFYLGLYPGVLGGLGLVAYRRSLTEASSATIVGTIVGFVLTVGVGMLGWEFIVWKANDHHLTLVRKLVVTAYPLGDLTILALVFRLIFAGAMRNGSLRLACASLGCFLLADAAWTISLKSGHAPDTATQHLMEMTSMSGYALMGAAALHPAAGDLTPRHQESPELSWPALAALAFLALTGPGVLGLELLLDHVCGPGCQ